MAHQSSTALEKVRAEERASVAGFASKLLQAAPRAASFANSAPPGGRALTLLSYCYRFVSNFAFLALVYFTLNFITKYEERTIIAALVLAYTAMRIASALRQFHFFSRIERLEAEARAAFTNVVDTPGKRQALREVATLRHQGELKAYMDLLFLGLITLLCIAKIIGS